MKDIFHRYKSVIRFVVLFLGTYLVLTFLYSWYLQSAKGGEYPPDFITHLVAKQSSDVLNGLGYEANVTPAADQPMMKLFVNDTYLAKIIEGCNAVSIIILFIAFIVAFAHKWKKTLLFILGGTVLIYGINIVRIAILAIALYKYPEYDKVLHTVVFPGIIYGMVFLLWMIWVRGLKQKNPKKA
ncbi:exosortase family protein XrtF [Aureisphaera galaxeae]|uniref:exosortase family protein XrtF n=1 Tax=Aureisphaera galaxeae TaxID=1538023 RepID=UPI002350D9DC|nr:exosortase family protein XrtF [Aureisphaera galaxeae]MDC8003050.1 exosortase family protein XrtF [Aureisphaera galaxeae]